MYTLLVSVCVAFLVIILPDHKTAAFPTEQIQSTSVTETAAHNHGTSSLSELIPISTITSSQNSEETSSKFIRQLREAPSNDLWSHIEEIETNNALKSLSIVKRQSGDNNKRADSEAQFFLNDRKREKEELKRLGYPNYYINAHWDYVA